MFMKFDITNVSNISLTVERKNKGDNYDISYSLGRIDGLDIDCDIEAKPLVERMIKDATKRHGDHPHFAGKGELVQKSKELDKDISNIQNRIAELEKELVKLQKEKEDRLVKAIQELREEAKGINIDCKKDI